MPAEEQAPRPRKPRRVTAAPQRVSESILVGVFELPHIAGRPTAAPEDPDPKHTGPVAEKVPGELPDASPDAAPDVAAGPGPTTSAKKPRSPKADPILEQRAAEDDPRRWGDADEDLGDWMKAQRPPHWD